MLAPDPLRVAMLSRASAGALAWQMGGTTRITLAIKARFKIQNQAVMEPIDPSPLVREDFSRTPNGSLDEPCELVPYLPSAGIVVKGHAWAPSTATPARAVSVRLAVFRGAWLIDKTLHVYGDRRPGEANAQPFSRLPIVYERAYGGQGADANPAGIGAGSPLLPNIIDARDARKPGGFGPIAPGWPARARLAPRMPSIRNGVMVLPEGFAAHYFQAAPPDQQIERLYGDEWLFLEGMHPDMPRLSTRLPSARGAAMRYRTDGAAPRPIEMIADTVIVDMDSLTCAVVFRGNFALEAGESPAMFRVFAGVEMPDAPLEWPDVDDLIDRAAQHAQAAPPPRPSQPGVAAPPAQDKPVVASGAVPKIFQEDDEVDDLKTTARVIPFNTPRKVEPAPPVITNELPKVYDDEPSMETAAISAHDLAARLKAIAPFAIAEPGKKSGPSEAIPGAPWRAAQPSAPQPASLPTSEDATQGFSIEEIHARAKRPIAPFAIAEPGALMPDKHRELPGAPWSVPAAQVIDDPTSHTAHHMAPIAISAAPDSPLFGSRPDPSPPAPFGGSRPDPAPPAMLGSRPEPAPFVAKPAPLIPALPPIPSALAPAPPPPLAPPPPPPAKLPTSPAIPALPAIPMLPAIPGKSAPEPEIAAPPGSPRAVLLGKLATGESLRGLDLTGADLRGVPWRGASLSGIILRDSKLAGAALAGAKLADVDLSGADLSGADLSGADMARADLSRADLSGAKLTDASLADAKLNGAKLASVAAPRSTWDRSDLREAKLTGADLSEASFQRASCAKADFSGAKLARADLQRATADGAVFNNASLGGADLRHARFLGASFEGADLREAYGSKADFSKASFARAKLNGAQLRASKLKEVNLSGSVLDGADLRDADLERADLRGSSRVGARVQGANTRDSIE